MRVSSDMPDDVLVLHDALARLREYKKGVPIVLHLKNSGTALRFLQVYVEKRYPGEPIVLTGDPRLMERDGKPTTQTTSARILHGENIPVEPDESPYITMSRCMAKSYSEAVLQQSGPTGVAGLTTQWSAERCWSSASYWYEYIALHGDSLLLEGLKSDSLQGDKVVADIYAKYFGVETTFTAEGAIIKKSPITNHQSQIAIDFVNCIDLYPAVALTCERLGIKLEASGTDRLRFKESDRIEAVQNHEVRNDHRMAMALMAADFPVSIEEQACIAKSYPNFVEQFFIFHFSFFISHITPIRGVNDDNLGKKHALSKLIHAATSEYVWLHDDDVVLPPICQSEGRSVSEAVCQWNGLTGVADLVILPLKMESLSEKPSLLEKLQLAEYAAIQELTMMTAKRNHAVMCSGANLIVRREVWLACEPELHPEIPSGDDMFLLEAAKRHAYTVTAIDDPAYTAVVRPLTSWKAFFCQRMRWAGKAPHYTDKDIIHCGRLVAFANILQLLCPPVLLIKFPIEWSLIKKREPQTSWLVALLLEIVYPIYLLICLIGGLFRKSW